MNMYVVIVFPTEVRHHVRFKNRFQTQNKINPLLQGRVLGKHFCACTHTAGYPECLPNTNSKIR